MTTLIEEYVKPGTSVPESQPGVDICGDRSLLLWRQFLRRKEPDVRPMALANVFRAGIMLDVKLQSFYDSTGCGRALYTGHAIGSLFAGVNPSDMDLSGARRIVFDNYSGAFRDAETRMPLSWVTALFLLPANRARYIP